MLTEQLASEIVKRTMSILDLNVNVMDRTGTILASGDPNRIGQLHHGASKAIEHKMTVEIHSYEENWRGKAKPGINLPIRFHDDIVGVIGITGEPEKIRGFSKLVQMGAELTLEQAFLTREIDRNARMRDDVISHLLLGSDKEQAYILDRARSLKINADETFAVILLSVPYHTSNLQSVKQIENWANTLVTAEDEIVRLYTNQFVILKKQQKPYLDTDDKIKNLLENKLSFAPISNITVALGPFSSGFLGWRQSFQTAQIVKDTAKTLYPEGGVWNQDTLGISILCYRFLHAAKEEADEISATYKKLFTSNDGKTLDETFTIYVKANGEMTKTADKLFIHRNTLAYRLDKIYEITGKNPKNLQDLIELKIGEILFKLSK
ncbi:CdaR family transcriptional regulator [Virgibacillus pantothenticus]|nr:MULTISPECIES: sugar diacid recognition domain-containing protein [Virgibacillus]MBS7428843.1 helix-turn-helix domain-containing protein [Virgibacillus sp. 19R1-5]MBU8568451.1 helix-turn-helix domain-containing protein [Virgibacillus pantothenticus]MBU8602448.1 helix-turn-helix domain-containing protein [Virgibacillus pantothenticus]MBU8636584.1 helix-turn-helix domain-containing protein [Virgibacillus pantothenticus]MBU8644310.1 helix-turn-helix domain-containing protein [Virgibacillus pant